MRIRFRVARHLVPLWVVSASAFALEVGDAWSEPPVDLGRPLGRIAMGDKTLYRWPDLEVTVAAGRVTQIRRLDAASVAAEAEERGKANASERARLLAERKERARRDAERAEKELAEKRARDRAAAEAADREAALRRQEAEKALAEHEAEARAAGQAAEVRAAQNAREKRAEADRAQEATRRQEDALARKETERRAEASAKLAAKARAQAAEREASARTRSASPVAGQAETGGVSLVKPPADPAAKLKREIEFLELDLKRAEAGKEQRDRAEAARLRLLLRERRAQLDAAAGSAP